MELTDIWIHEETGTVMAELNAARTSGEVDIRLVLQISGDITAIKNIHGLTIDTVDICIPGITTGIKDIYIPGITTGIKDIYIPGITIGIKDICITGLTIDFRDISTSVLTIGITGTGKIGKLFCYESV